MMKKHFLLYILIILLIIFGLLLINKNSKDKTEGTVVFWTLQLGTFDKYINNIIRNFEKENPDIHIEWIDIPYSEGEKRTLAAILTDNPPDIVNLTPDFSLLLAQKKALHSIKNEDLSQFLPSIADSLKYNDEYFGIPFYATSAVTLYNKDLVNKLPIKEFPQTYDDLFNIPFNKNAQFFLTMINFSENDTLLKLLNKYGINSPQNINSRDSIKLFTKLKEIYDNDIIPKESITQTHRDALEKYMSGQIAFLVTGANFINMIKENAPSVYTKTGVLPQLTGDTGAYDYSLMNFIIPKRAKNKDAALKFALYLTNKNNQLEFAKLTTILPVNKYSLEDDYFKIDTDNDLQSKARIISARQLDNLQKPIPNIKNKKELNTLSSNSIQEIIINNADTKKILDKFSLDWQEL